MLISPTKKNRKKEELAEGNEKPSLISAKRRGRGAQRTKRLIWQCGRTVKPRLGGISKKGRRKHIEGNRRHEREGIPLSQPQSLKKTSFGLQFILT